VHYDAAVFTLGGFVPPDLPIGRAEIIPPAIDPESPKNMELTPDLANAVLQWIGVDVDRPLVTQVSRFDPWKDPMGAIKAYRLAKDEIPDLQLALVGSMALDDPEGWDIYEEIRDEGDRDPDIAIHTNLTGTGNIGRASVWWFPKRCGRARPWWLGAWVASPCRWRAAWAACWWIPSRRAHGRSCDSSGTAERPWSWAFWDGSWCAIAFC
jgi:glycosyltransferase involved in cell wall biosynthesis